MHPQAVPVHPMLMRQVRRPTRSAGMPHHTKSARWQLAYQGHNSDTRQQQAEMTRCISRQQNDAFFMM
jgi:hypothetical protein